jgi:hypothetical protein
MSNNVMIISDSPKPVPKEGKICVKNGSKVLWRMSSDTGGYTYRSWCLKSMKSGQRSIFNTCSCRPATIAEIMEARKNDGKSLKRPAKVKWNRYGYFNV